MVTNIRRFSIFVLACAFLVGGVVTGGQAAHMAAKMLSAASSDAMSSDCDGWAAGDQSMPGACFAFCTSATAVLPVAEMIAAKEVLSCVSAPVAERVVGCHGPPDPYPPRSIFLS